ncbi:hypothetical protein ACFVFJ_48250 [Streptomyces sp. NPDC057717]|uniref:hypothetical protein n=1 Tax=Streptomyces sp. NPDC057717 TaxID=3346224 RepID=UPI0036C6DF04
MMRLVWLAAISVLAIVMAVFTPYVLHTESTWQAAAWLIMLAAMVTGIALLIRGELLLHRLGRQPGATLPKPDPRGQKPRTATGKPRG